VIHPCCVGLVRTRAEADIQHGGAVLKGPDQIRLLLAVDNFVEIDVLVP
jgi:hypothetical protein